MTVHSLILAVTVGLAIGVVGRVVLCRGRPVPLWLPVAAAVAAAVLVTVIARTANTDRPELTALEIILQVLFATAAVALVAATTDAAPDGAPQEPDDRQAAGRHGATPPPPSRARTSGTWPRLAASRERAAAREKARRDRAGSRAHERDPGSAAAH